MEGIDWLDKGWLSDVLEYEARGVYHDGRLFAKLGCFVSCVVFLMTCLMCFSR